MYCTILPRLWLGSRWKYDSIKFYLHISTAWTCLNIKRTRVEVPRTSWIKRCSSTCFFRNIFTVLRRFNLQEGCSVFIRMYGYIISFREKLRHHTIITFLRKDRASWKSTGWHSGGVRNVCHGPEYAYRERDESKPGMKTLLPFLKTLYGRERIGGFWRSHSGLIKMLAIGFIRQFQ